MEDWKKKYYDLVNRLKKARNSDDEDERFGVVLDSIAPELAESEREDEDERIRKSLIKSFTNQHSANFPTVDGFTREQIIAYLEKQKEQKPQIKLVFPKFRVGDIIQHIPLEKWDTTKKITHIDETGYYFDHSHQGDTVSGGFIGFSFENDYELVEQKPAEWSEKDEKTLKELICYIENWKQRTKDKSYNHTLWSSDINECDRFISLLNSIHPQPEWSEENDTAIHLACEFIRHHSRKKDTIGGIYCDELVMMLKSLRPQPHWKPSEEQMEVDFEKEIARTYHDGSVADTSDMDHVDYENIARHFYELGINARKL